MKKIVVIAGLLILCIAVIPGMADSSKTSSSSREILDYVDDLFRGSSSFATMTMKVVTRHYTREMTMEGWSKGKDYSLLRILAPLKEKGTATLKAGNNIWNYLPKVKRVIKIPSSMMGGSWMGSHFSNDDLVKESRMADDYTHAITFKGVSEAIDVIELTLTPNSDAAVVWGKVVVTVRQKDLMPVKIDYYGERLDLIRTMVFTDIRKMGDRLLPATLLITPVDKPGEYTEIIYEEIDFDIVLKDDFFSLRTLQSGSTP